jgi:uncharacterized membrane-anchored protein
MYRTIGDSELALKYAEEAVTIAPRLELASTVLFSALNAVGRTRDAIREVLRLVTLRYSKEYDEFLSRISEADIAADPNADLLAQIGTLLRSHGPTGEP